ncbi:MAG: hypothetical protein GTO02_14765 [Candidatus Dadabacteria bacterium]|nr:hypothetical protein [Candidatus Dadabacteria bacterium]
MTFSFLEAWEKACRIKEAHDDAAVSAIFTGINVAEDFWDNFILVCNNNEGLAALLNVDSEKIASWPAIVQEHLEKAKSEKNPESKEKTHILDTGEL